MFNNGHGYSSSFKHHSIGSEYLFSFLPRRCFKSNKLIWFKKAFRQTAMWTGPGTPVFEVRWYDDKEYVVAKLKGEI